LLVQGEVGLGGKPSDSAGSLTIKGYDNDVDWK
jgi:hypothetical protein